MTDHPKRNRAKHLELADESKRMRAGFYGVMLLLACIAASCNANKSFVEMRKDESYMFSLKLDTSVHYSVHPILDSDSTQIEFLLPNHKLAFFSKRKQPIIISEARDTIPYFDSTFVK